MKNQPKDVEDISKAIAIELTATLDAVLFKGKYPSMTLETIEKTLQKKIAPIVTTLTDKRVRELDKENFSRVVSFLNSRERVITEQKYPKAMAYDDLKFTIRRLEASDQPKNL